MGFPEVDETRQRLRSKWLERQLSRGPGSRVGPERRTLLLEMAQLQLAAGRSKAALQPLGDEGAKLAFVGKDVISSVGIWGFHWEFL